MLIHQILAAAHNCEQEQDARNPKGQLKRGCYRSKRSQPKSSANQRGRASLGHNEEAGYRLLALADTAGATRCCHISQARYKLETFLTWQHRKNMELSSC